MKINTRILSLLYSSHCFLKKSLHHWELMKKIKCILKSKMEISSAHDKNFLWRKTICIAWTKTLLPSCGIRIYCIFLWHNSWSTEVRDPSGFLGSERNVGNFWWMFRACWRAGSYLIIYRYISNNLYNGRQVLFIITEIARWTDALCAHCCLIFNVILCIWNSNLVLWILVLFMWKFSMKSFENDWDELQV